jgi:hypothetical protein
MKRLLFVLSVSVLGHVQTNPPQNCTAIISSYEVFELVECKDTVWREDNTFWIDTFFCDSLVERKVGFYDIAFDFHGGQVSIGDIDLNMWKTTIDTSYWAIEYIGCCDESTIVDSDCELHVQSEMGTWFLDYCKETLWLQYGSTSTRYKLYGFTKY